MTGSPIPADEVVIDLPTTMPELSAIADLLNDMWGSTLVVGGLLRAIAHAGGYVASVHRHGQLIGGSVAFLGSHDGRPTLHSHITGVRPTLRGVGSLVKQHQREWCRQRGIVAVTWTFDPLIARNAYFNLHKLGVRCTAYLPDHYGQMTDAINAGEATDRFAAIWRVEPLPRPSATVQDATLLLDRDDAAEPVPLASVADAAGGPIAIRIPRDIEAIREDVPGLSPRWREATRPLLVAAMAAGYVAVDMTRDGTYLLVAEEGA